MNIIQRPIRITPIGIVSAVLVAAIGFLYLLDWLRAGAVFVLDGNWTPLLFFGIAALCFTSALGMSLTQRWGVYVFLMPCAILIARLAFLLVTVGDLDKMAALLGLFSTLVTVLPLTIAACLIASVMWFHRKWLSRIGLPLAAFFIVPSYCLSLLALAGPGQARPSQSATPEVLQTTVPQLSQTVLAKPASVQSASYSRDGKRIVTGSNDGTVRIWDASSGQILATMSGDGSVGEVVWSPDDRQIVTVSEHGPTVVWDAVTGKRVTVLPGENSAIVGAVGYSPDGTRIAIASTDGTVRILDASNWNQLLVLAGHTGSVWTASYSPDGKHIVTAGNDGTARIFDAARGQPLAVLKDGHTINVMGATYSPDGKKILTAGFDMPGTTGAAGNIEVWDAATGKPLNTLVQRPVAYRHALFSPDGKQVLITVNYEPAEVWDFETGQQLAVLRGDKAQIWSALYSPDGRQILTAHEDGTARKWDVATWRQVFVLDPYARIAKSTPTAIAQTGITSTPTPFLPQATAPAATVLAAQSLLETSSSWNVVLSDSFDNNANVWETSSYSGGTFQAAESIAGGRYHWDVKATNGPALDWELPEMRTYQSPAFGSPPGESPKMLPMSDFMSSVEGRQISGTPNGRYGLIFRWMPGQTFYLFDIADDQSYKLSIADKEDPGKTLFSGKSAAIKPGEVNRLTVIAQGSHFAFFVNKQFVAQADDDALAKGVAGPVVELFNAGDEAVFEFDNFEVRAPQ